MWPFKKTQPVAEPATTPPIKENLSFIFEDTSAQPGKRFYYKFTDLTLMPIDRIALIYKLNIEATRGLTTSELHNLLDIAEKHIHEGLKNPSNAAKVTGVLHEIKIRESMISDLEVYYGMFAASYIREDEDPMVFNHQAQLEKVQAFKSAAQTPNSFFFALEEYNELCKRLNILTNDWQSVIEASGLVENRKRASEELLK